MAASITDKISSVSSGVRPVSTTVSTVRNSGATTLACADLTGWATAEIVFFVTYKVDGQGSVIVGSQSDWKGLVSGSNINSLTLTGGADAGNAVGDIVEILPTAEWAKKLAEHILTSHDQDGTLKAGAVDVAAVLASDVVTTAKILNSNVTTAKIADSNVTTAKIADDNITDAKLVNGKVYRRQGGNANDWNVVGSTTYDTSASDVKIQSGMIFNNASPKTITFPVAFTNKPVVYASVTSVNSASCFAIPLDSSVSTTGFSCQVYDNAGSTNNAQNISWIAVGI
jgi:hypothetical protein